MMRRRAHQVPVAQSAPAFDDFHDWVLSLPWVVEQTHRLGTPGARSFAVDCEPLQRRRLWLLTGLDGALAAHEMSIAVIVPIEAATAIESAGLGRAVGPIPGPYAIVTVKGGAVNGRHHVEALALTAYGHAMS